MHFTDKTQYPIIAKLGVFIPIIVVLFSFIAADELLTIVFWSIILAVVLFATWYMFFTKLLLKGSEQGIYYQLKPFQKKKVFLPFNEILELEIEATDFLTKFGGWGKRKKGNEKAYVFNDGYFLKVKTDTRTYYFSISDQSKQQWEEWINKNFSKLNINS